MSSEEELVIWVPARLLYHAGRDADLRHFLADNLLRSGLFPAKLPAEVTARHWAAIYMNCDAKVGHWGRLPQHFGKLESLSVRSSL